MATDHPGNALVQHGNVANIASSDPANPSPPTQPPPRGSSRNPSVTGDTTGADNAGPDGGQDAAGAGKSLTVPGEQPEGAAAAGVTGTTERQDSVGRGSKRSLTGRGFSS